MEQIDPLFFIEMRAFQLKYNLRTDEIISFNEMRRFEIGENLFDLTKDYKNGATAALRRAVARRYLHLSEELVALEELAIH